MNSAENKSMFCALLVDADIGFRQALSDILRVYFPLVGVEETGDWEEALNKVDYLHPNIVFTDIQLPGDSGLRLSKEIKQVYSDIVVVILTTEDPADFRQAAFMNGADYYISKEDHSCMEEILIRIETEMDMFLPSR
jgi:DNA-binding NarL/FixJ family response regulator